MIDVSHKLHSVLIGLTLHSALTVVLSRFIHLILTAMMYINIVTNDAANTRIIIIVTYTKAVSLVFRHQSKFGKVYNIVTYIKL